MNTTENQQLQFRSLSNQIGEQFLPVANPSRIPILSEQHEQRDIINFY